MKTRTVVMACVGCGAQREEKFPSTSLAVKCACGARHWVRAKQATEPA